MSAAAFTIHDLDVPSCLRDHQLPSGQSQFTSDDDLFDYCGIAPNARRVAGLPRREANDLVLDPQAPWLAESLARIAFLSGLSTNWNSYGASPPTEGSLCLSRLVLNAFAELDCQPSSIDPSAEGGVCISFRNDDKYADIECFNTGSILGVLSSPGSDADVWEILLDRDELHEAAARIFAYINR